MNVRCYFFVYVETQFLWHLMVNVEASLNCTWSVAIILPILIAPDVLL